MSEQVMLHDNRHKWLMLRARALRAFSFPVSVLPVLIAAAAVRRPHEWDLPVLAASAIGVALLHGAGNLLNDYYDFRRDVDRRTAGDAGRPGRFLIRGELAPRDVLIEALACLALAAPILAFLAWRCGAGTLAFAAAAAFALYAYTGPPFHFKYRALGEPLIFIVFGPLLLAGAAYAQTGRIEPIALLLSVPVGFLTTAILVGNNVRDSEEDSEAGIVTLAQVVGVRAMRVGYAVLVLAGALGIAALAAARLLPLALLAAPVALVLVWTPLTATLRGQRMPDIDARTAKFESVLLVFVLVVLVFL